MKHVRIPLKRGFICEASPSGKCSYREHLTAIRTAHELNKEEVGRIMRNAPKIPYAKCWDKWIQLTPEQAEQMKNDLTIEWR
jgi:hypothetical protein